MVLGGYYPAPLGRVHRLPTRSPGDPLGGGLENAGIPHSAAPVIVATGEPIRQKAGNGSDAGKGPIRGAYHV